MNWLFIALLAPILWAATNHIDKLLVSRYFKGSTIGALAIFSSLIGLVILPIIYIVNPNVLTIGFSNALLLVLSGFFYIIATVIYLYAIQKDEASIVVPLFQTIPIFSYVLALIFLNEQLNTGQILAGLVIIFGAIILTLELNLSQKVKFKADVFWLMMASSFVYSLNLFLFKFVGISGGFWQTSFWEYFGFIVAAGIIWIFIPKWRQDFLNILNGFKSNALNIFSINALNETLNIVAKMIFNFASLLAPLALVSLVNGFQPIFVFIFGIILTLLWPSLGKESITKKDLVQKFIAIVIILFGAYLIQIQ